MMIIQRTALILLAAGMAALPADAAAQERRFGPSVEASLGPSVGIGGPYTHRAGGSMDAVLTMPVATTSRSTVILGLTGTAAGSMGGDDICIVGADETCLQDYPTFVSLGVVGGVQRRLSSSLSARVLGGPAYFQSVDGDDTFGLQGRVDVARATPLPRTAIVASLRGSLLPRYEGETLRFAGIGLGLRIQ